MICIIDKVHRRNEISDLWNKCFGDNEEYISFFLDNCKSVCLGYVEDNRLVSMLFLLNGTINNFSVKYIYAACTLTEYRGRGIMGKLIEASKVYCTENNIDAIFLVPGEESLYDYYSRFGFVSKFKRSYAEYNQVGINLESMNELTDINHVSEIRKELLADYDCFIFDDKTLNYSVKEHFFNGGKVYFTESMGEKFLLFVIKTDSKIYIKELLFKKSDNLFEFIEHFINNGKENIYIQYPIVYNNTDKMVKYAKCGMYYPLTDEFKESSVNKDFYAGLYLD